jgi:hypothetical protein
MVSVPAAVSRRRGGVNRGTPKSVYRPLFLQALSRFAIGDRSPIGVRTLGPAAEDTSGTTLTGGGAVAETEKRRSADDNLEDLTWRPSGQADVHGRAHGRVLRI